MVETVIPRRVHAFQDPHMRGVLEFVITAYCGKNKELEVSFLPSFVGELYGNLQNKRGGTQYRPQNTIILIFGTLKRNPLFWETPICDGVARWIVEVGMRHV